MKAWAACILLTITCISCSKDPQHRIPEVYVDFRISEVDFNKNARQGLLVVNPQPNAGVAGLIIYRLPDNSYIAYDRCSSVNPSERCAVIPDSSNQLLEDPCSGAKFSIFDGSAVKAPATRPLKQYQVVLSSFNIMVRN